VKKQVSFLTISLIFLLTISTFAFGFGSSMGMSTSSNFGSSSGMSGGSSWGSNEDLQSGSSFGSNLGKSEGIMGSSWGSSRSINEGYSEGVGFNTNQNKGINSGSSFGNFGSSINSKETRTIYGDGRTSRSISFNENGFGKSRTVYNDGTYSQSRSANGRTQTIYSDGSYSESITNGNGVTKSYRVKPQGGFGTGYSENGQSIGHSINSNSNSQSKGFGFSGGFSDFGF